MGKIGKNFSAISASDHGFRNIRKLYWNMNQRDIYKISLDKNEGKLSKDGVLVVKTGVHTGRSANDKYIVKSNNNEETIWWDNNKAIKEENFDFLYEDVIEYCEGKEIFVQDLFGGADPSHRLSTRIYTEYAWHSLFIQNLLIEVEDVEKKDFHLNYH